MSPYKPEEDGFVYLVTLYQISVDYVVIKGEVLILLQSVYAKEKKSFPCQKGWNKTVY
jgi:hypothetical protein